MKVMIVGGGTGGHIYPALAAVPALHDLGVGAEDLLWIGTKGQTEETLIPRAGLTLETISGGPLAGLSLPKRLLNGLKLGRGFLQAHGILSRFKPSVLLLTGGYVNVPVAFAAKMRKIPMVIYLPDVEPGGTLKRLIDMVQKVACTTAASEAFVPREKLAITGYPVRPVLRDALALSQADARSQFELPSERRTLFVFGGSRGAQSINRALMRILPDLLTKYQVIHVSGTLTWDEVEANAELLDDGLRRFYRPFPYLHEEMGVAFRAADLVIARGGASMLGESPAFGLPSILVPYPHAWRYQKVNADYLVDNGAAIRLDDDRLTEELLPTIEEMLANENRLAEMKSAAKTLDIPDAAKNLASIIVQVGRVS